MKAEVFHTSAGGKLELKTPLGEALILSRPNRYVAELRLPDGSQVRGHVPVGGRIGGLTLDGLPALISGPYVGRATDYTVEAIGSHYSRENINFQWIGINQTASNRYVGSLLRAGLLPDLANDKLIPSLKSEQKLGGKRIDFAAGKGDPSELWIEVKTPLIELNTELDSDLPIKTDFADGAPSARMPEQFEELAKIAKAGGRVVFLGVFGYSTLATVDSQERYRKNLNLDGLVDRGVELGMEFAELELSVNKSGVEFRAYRALFGGR